MSAEYMRAWRQKRLAKPDGAEYARKVAQKMRPISRRWSRKHHFRRKFQALLEARILPATIPSPAPSDAEAVLHWWSEQKLPGRKHTIIRLDSALAADVIATLQALLIELEEKRK